MVSLIQKKKKKFKKQHEEQKQLYMDLWQRKKPSVDLLICVGLKSRCKLQHGFN